MYLTGFLDKSSALSQAAFAAKVDQIVGKAQRSGALKALSLKYFGKDYATHAADYDVGEAASEDPVGDRRLSAERGSRAHGDLRPQPDGPTRRVVPRALDPDGGDRVRGDVLPRQGHARVLGVRAPGRGRRCQDRSAQQLGRRPAAQPGVHRHAAAGRQRGRSPALRGLDGGGEPARAQRAGAAAGAGRAQDDGCAGVPRARSERQGAGFDRAGARGQGAGPGGATSSGRVAHRGREPVHVHRSPASRRSRSARRSSCETGRASGSGCSQQTSTSTGSTASCCRTPGSARAAPPTWSAATTASSTRSSRPAPTPGRSTRAASTARSRGNRGRGSTPITTACR